MDQQPAKQRRKAGRPPKSEREAIDAQKERWLQEFQTKGWRGACNAIGISQGTPSNWRLSDPAFRAKHEALTPLVAEDLERLVEEVIAGQRTMDKVQMTLLIFRLKALKPSLYRERWSVEHSGPDGGAIKVEQTGEAQHGMTLLKQWGGRLANN
jgi:hypothetical protein